MFLIECKTLWIRFGKTGGRHNPDLPKEDILDGYPEWLELGKPKG